MTPAGPVCASCKQLGQSRKSNLSCPLNPRNKTLLIPRKRTSDNLSTQEEYQTESSRAGASRPRVETVQNPVVLTIAEIIALSCADQYSAESSRDLTAAFEALQVSAVERVLDLTTTTAITTATVIPRCSSCNGIGHLRSNSLQCPNNRRHHTFVPGQFLRKKIRRYNSTISFTSMGVNIDQSVANNIGDAYNFRIHGTICHKTGSVLPTTQTQMDQPKFAQVYIFDPASQVDHRHCNAPELDRVILEKIQAVLMEVNPFVSLFRSMHQVARDNDGTADMTFCLAESGSADQQRYNTPTVEKVAVLMSDTEHNEARDIILHTQTDYLHKINEYHHNYDALQYVLLFPSGDFGWTINRYTPTRSKISTMDWYANHLMYHPNFMHLLHRFGCLFQQYIVDMYAKIEHSRLGYYVLNQKKMCAELYSSIQDAVHLNDNDMTNLGWPQVAYHVVMEAVDASSTTLRLYFVNGPGGTGKIFLFNAMLRKVHQQGKIALAVATSEIAALLLDGSETTRF
ncbi:hypothetical protein PHYBLDRAFT_169701 [Phycomyces blakesleeanus NRRL 1555(-)]|uniref:ATP-dependent DNA helicase n=1 Tax=Phycomyces blakesleeanus (strain ATCC 8743b / DSM 1359 / FGSC 10004 / NBRC 33097 / NRRL 1555) TaxID=763407 RepID=A0A162U5W4_PHYB8|nr:hypothetical protein PHYBLDRAFT_169701 [Phycomyces blakesleeanus NRRL 1555(-)]OAD72573.1 hypothetical protein PHYBLDRAFT_169701 [Phycomyces blakesleeanus NRRL 1555(-)]|eukprot:XP_018290613.1 hypothetical protein PHYBLDRAFT_169701 [Phycomyces blakesleeanus NRRL 1555(-)]